MSTFLAHRHRGLPAIARAALAAVALVLALSALAPSPSQAAVGPPLEQSNFDARRHGFQFVNSWTKTLSTSLPVVGRVNFASFSFGLCGGMAYAALDSYNLDKQTPKDTKEPAPGSTLRDYIFGRQVDSLTADNASALRTFIASQARPIDDKTIFGRRIVKGLKTITREQFTGVIKPRLDAGKPVPLGIVKASAFQSPLKNHQVLATGYRTIGTSGDALIAVYDPNYPITKDNPDGITYLQLKTRQQFFDAGGFKPTGDSFRGIFTTKYTAKTPPWAR